MDNSRGNSKMKRQLLRLSGRKIARAMLVPFVPLLVALIAPSAQAVPAKVALIHSFPVLGNVAANISTLNSLVEEAFLEGANIVVTPELATTGFSITNAEVLDDLGLTDPYPELSFIRDLAIQHQGYVAIAIAEVTEPDQLVYNTVVLFGPSGLVTTQQKRGLSGFHERGILPFDVVPTIYGDLGLMICSDVYLPEWNRIATIKGADLVLLPANWWGSSGQEQIWQTRARENGIWFLTANRWGTETDTRYGFPFVYDMNDAPSAAITPDGEIQLIYRAQDVANPEDRILYYSVDVPEYRIGNTINPSYSVNFRRPEAYSAIANLFYRPDLGNQMVPGLPPDGTTRIASIAYKPHLSPAVNVATVEQLWTYSGEAADVVVLPGLGVTTFPIDTANPNWHQANHWADLQAFVEDNGILLLVTTALELGGSSGLPQTLVALRPGEPPLLSRQIHDSLTGLGTGAEPIYLDLPHARVGLLTGRDLLFPEASLHLTKSGIDILVVPSTVGAAQTSHDVNAPSYFWEPAALLRLWRTRTDQVFHLATSDWTGNGVVIEVTGGIIGHLETSDAANPVAALDTITNSDPFSFDSVRVKFLNAYYPFDLDVLLGN